jgi:diacylglycerol O-acyltransferase / wax synthase
MSYNGKMDFGLLGDYDAMPDIDSFGELLEESLAELLDTARSVAKPESEQRKASASAPPDA